MALERRPLLTKSLTSGVMYAAGDAIAQVAEARSAPTAPAAAPAKPFSFNKTRLLIFLVYGTVIGGPAYHYWFGWLDRLPLQMYQLRQHRHRTEIMRAYSLLKRHGVPVDLKLEALPMVPVWGAWTEKAMKIAADQIVFSSFYTLLFFTVIGLATGAAEKRESEAARAGMEEYEARLRARYAIAIAPAGGAQAGGAAAAAKDAADQRAVLREELMRLRALLGPPPAAAAAPTAAAAAAVPAAVAAAAPPAAELGRTGEPASALSAGALSAGAATAGAVTAGAVTAGAATASAPPAGAPGTVASLAVAPSAVAPPAGAPAAAAGAPAAGGVSEASEALDRILRALHDEADAAHPPVSWAGVVARTAAHTRAVFWETYLADCVVWPPLQLINFSLVPLRYQVLYVNSANLFWNAFLSMMANKSSH